MFRRASANLGDESTYIPKYSNDYTCFSFLVIVGKQALISIWMITVRCNNNRLFPSCSLVYLQHSVYFQDFLMFNSVLLTINSQERARRAKIRREISHAIFCSISLKNIRIFVIWCKPFTVRTFPAKLHIKSLIVVGILAIRFRRFVSLWVVERKK